MSVIRNQDYFSVAINGGVALAAGVDSNVLLPRARTLPPLSNTIDHVVNPARS